MVSQTGPTVVRPSNSCKGPVYPEKGPKKSQRVKRIFWGQKVLFGTKFLKFDPKGPTWQYHCHCGTIADIKPLRFQNKVFHD